LRFVTFTIAIFSVTGAPFNKILLTAAAQNDGAVCIDGTPSAYFYRPGTGSGANKWYIHHEGGGWCYNLGDCFGRSKTDLGSSKNYPMTMNNDGGYFSESASNNPLMYNWNAVYLKYCDGGSFSGNNESAADYNGAKLYFRGIRILTAMFQDLFRNRRLSGATDVVVSGCSAGGLATYLHLDWWRTNLPSNIRVVGMPDSGFFRDFEGPPRYHSNMMWVFNQMNSTSGVNADCIRAFAPSKTEWSCIFAEHTAPFIRTPIFPLQSVYDSWQVGNDLGSNDPAQINAYGNAVTQLVTKGVLSRPANSVFLDSCEHHCGNWNNMMINGQSQATAFKLWYEGTAARYIQGKPYPCPSCC